MLTLVPANNLPPQSVRNYWQEFDEIPNNKPEHYMNSLLTDKNEYIGLLEAEKPFDEKLFFYLVKESRSKYIIGHCTIILNPFDETKDSNIKAAVRPSEENKGWEYYLLELAFGKCHDIGLDELTLLCFDYYDETLELCFQRLGATFRGFYSDKNLEPCLGSLCKVRYTINLQNHDDKSYDHLDGSVVLKILSLFKKKRP